MLEAQEKNQGEQSETPWKVDSEVKVLDANMSGLRDADPNSSVITTTLVTGQRVSCIFTQHSPFIADI